MSSLTSQMSNLGLGNPKLLVVDALNFLSEFVPCDEAAFVAAEAGVLFAEARHRLADFAAALKRAGIKAIFVFDNGQTSEEANLKWLQRRQREVETEKKSLPCSAEIFLRAMLEDHGFTIYSPAGIDGDDAVALLALKLGACVLSRDQDMLRYGLAQGRVFCDFAIRNGAITFCVRTGKSRVEERSVKGMECDLAKWALPGSSFVQAAEAGKMRRGNPDAYTKASGNLHAVARPLRAALYARLKLKEVLETLPAWVDGAFKMIETKVLPDGSLDALLDDPQKMFAWVLERGGDVRRRHPAAVIAAEIHVHATPSQASVATRIRDAYDTLVPPLDRAGPQKGWCAGGKCSGLFNPPKICKGDWLCFPMNVQSAKYNGKDPLCDKCIQFLITQSAAKRARQQHGRRY